MVEITFICGYCGKKTSPPEFSKDGKKTRCSHCKKWQTGPFSGIMKAPINKRGDGRRMKMVDYDEQNEVARAMMKWGGNFTRYLGEALIRADLKNAQKVHDAFPDIWEEYLKKSEEK